MKGWREGVVWVGPPIGKGGGGIAPPRQVTKKLQFARLQGAGQLRQNLQ